MKNFKQYLTEAPLSPAHKRQVDDMVGKHVPDPKTSDRIEIPLQGEHVSPHPEVENLLKQHGYQITDYASGLAKSEKGQTIKIGKALEKTKAHDSVKTAFSQDPRRHLASKANADLKVVISKHPHDVANCSTNQHWTSCMNLDGGSNRHYIRRDIEHGTHAAYLVHKDDHNLENPVARLLIKPFHHHDDDPKEDHTIIRPEGQVYGNAPPSFHATVQKWSEENHPAHPDKHYRKNEELYDDGGVKEVVGKNIPGKMLAKGDLEGHIFAAKHGTAEHVSKVLEGMHKFPDYDHAIVRAVSKNPNATADHIRRISTSREAFGRPSVVENIGNHPNTPHDVIDNLIDISKHGDSLAGSPHLTHEHIDKMMQNFPDTNTGNELAKHPNLAPRHFKELADTLGGYGKQHLAAHPKLPVEIQHQLAEDSNGTVREVLAGNPKLHKDVFKKMMDGEGSGIRGKLVRTHKLTDEMVEHITKNETNHVKSHMVYNQNLTKDQIHHIIKHEPEEFVRNQLAEHPKIDESHLHAMLKGNEEGKITAPNLIIHHPKANESHYEAAAKSTHEDTRFRAARSEGTPDHILHQLKDDPDHLIAGSAVRNLARREREKS